MAKAVKENISVLPEEFIINRIYNFRGQKVMLDKDLAELYGVATKVLNQAVKRNSERFPADFMFQLTKKEYEILKSQFVTSNWGGSRKLPFAFTEQGVSMLSGVLNSAVAIQVHIQIIRIFIKMREMLMTNKDILLKLERVEKQIKANKEDIASVFNAIRQLITKPAVPRKRIGFKPDD
ncbi:MAG: ORF6N domain-containing protein [Ferruginibacter sp.]